MADPRPWGVLQDEAAVSPGLIATIARLRDIVLRVHCRARGLPHVKELGALVVLGDVSNARGLLSKAIDEDVPVLAVGVGAGLLAAALGAAVYHCGSSQARVAPVY